MQHVEQQFVLRTLPAAEAKSMSRAAREREAKASGDSLTPQQEACVLRRTGFAQMASSCSRPSSQP